MIVDGAAIATTAAAIDWLAAAAAIDGGPVATAAGSGGLIETAADAAIVLVSLLSLLCGYRVVRGPTVPDRVVGLDAIATNVVAIAVLFALKTGRGLFVTVSLVLAIIGFLSTVAVAKFVTEGDIIVRRE